MKMLTEKEITFFANKAARKYIAKFGESKQIDCDDAFSIACLEICEHAEYDDTRTDYEICAYFVKKGYFAIVHEYNTINKPIKDREITIVSLDTLDNVDVIEDESDDYVPDESQKEALRNWIDKWDNPLEAFVLKAVVNGESRKVIAKEAGISEGRISQIIKRFQEQARVAVTLRENFQYIGGNDVSADAKQMFPLFFQ